MWAEGAAPHSKWWWVLSERPSLKKKKQGILELKKQTKKKNRERYILKVGYKETYMIEEGGL